MIIFISGHSITESVHEQCSVCPIWTTSSHILKTNCGNFWMKNCQMADYQRIVVLLIILPQGKRQFAHSQLHGEDFHDVGVNPLLSGGILVIFNLCQMSSLHRWVYIQEMKMAASRCAIERPPSSRNCCQVNITCHAVLAYIITDFMGMSSVIIFADTPTIWCVDVQWLRTKIICDGFSFTSFLSNL